MPPASPVPGWSSGEVCTLTMATRRTASASVSSTTSPLPPHNTGPTASNRTARPVIPAAASGGASEGGPARRRAAYEQQDRAEPDDGAEDGVDQRSSLTESRTIANTPHTKVGSASATKIRSGSTSLLTSSMPSPSSATVSSTPPPHRSAFAAPASASRK